MFHFCTNTFPYDEASLHEFGPDYEGETRGFWHPDPDGHPSSKYTIRVGWSDSPPHLTPEMKRNVMRGQRSHMKVAREEGYPVAGQGRIYPIEEQRVACHWFQIPDWFPRLYSIDPGWGTTAALFYAYDPDADVIYVTNEYYEGKKPPHVHARALNAYGGDWMPGVLDPYAGGKLYDGKNMVELYCNEGLDVTLGDDWGVQRGIEECYGRMETGRLKVFGHCRNFFWELVLYQYAEDGKPNKRAGKDHLMDTMRIGVASIGRGLSRARHLAVLGAEHNVGAPGQSHQPYPWTAGKHWRRSAADKVAGF